MITALFFLNLAFAKDQVDATWNRVMFDAAYTFARSRGEELVSKPRCPTVVGCHFTTSGGEECRSTRGLRYWKMVARIDCASGESYIVDDDQVIPRELL